MDAGGGDPLRVCVYGHSAGGLVATLWLDRLRQARRRGTHRRPRTQQPVLRSTRSRNSAYRADVGGTHRASTVAQAAGDPQADGGRWAYGTTLHRDYAGEFDYDLDLKPLGGFPITFGWINAIRRGQARLHRGLDVGVPNLILRSDRSVPEAPDPSDIQRGDAVLDVRQIARWAGCVGNHQTIAPIADAKHDVFLSLTEPRAAAYRELGRWLDDYLGSEKRSTTNQSGRG